MVCYPLVQMQEWTNGEKKKLFLTLNKNREQACPACHSDDLKLAEVYP